MLISPDDLRRVRKGMIRHVFGVGYAAITKWMPGIDEIGANNGDDTFDLIKIIQWKCDQKGKKPEGREQLEMAKLEKEVELKEAQIQRVLDNYIEKTIAYQEKIALLKIISNFLERVPSYRKQQFHMIHSDIAEKKLRDLFAEAMEQVASASEVIE